MPSAVFDRWQPHNGKTLCYSHFKRNEVAINDYFWHTSGILYDASRKSMILEPNDYVNSIFNYGDDLGNRKDTFIKDFNIIQNENTNLFRLLSLIACASYFEHYLNQSLRLAMYSNIGVVFGQTKTLDGTKLLKSKENFPFQMILKDMVQGTWKNRYKKISNVFKVEITSIKDNIEQLEAERIRRNMIAHQFALDGDTRFLDRIDLSFFERNKIAITDDELKNNFLIIRKVVDEIELKISGPNVGLFELILLVHYYKNDVDNFKSKMPAEYRGMDLRKIVSSFSKDNGAQNISRVKAQQIISFYDAA